MCKYYINVGRNQYVRAYIINPTIACSENIDQEYIDIFENNELITLNNSMYSNNSDRGTEEYRTWLKECLKRDSYTCQCCDSKINPEVHHILNYSQYKSLRTNIENGITLCECCHNSIIKGSYHNTYGTKNNTREQLKIFIDNKRNELGLPPKTI
jgi:hypothetical protein